MGSQDAVDPHLECVREINALQAMIISGASTANE